MLFSMSLRYNNVLLYRDQWMENTLEFQDQDLIQETTQKYLDNRNILALTLPDNRSLKNFIE